MDRTTTPDLPACRELFIVEGVSAASSVRQAMDRRTQSVFALQGKVINVDRAPRSRVEANPVCASLFATLGCGIAADCEPSKLTFSRIVLLTDPDVDGAHSRMLLARLFARFLEPLLHAGRVFAVIPPVWRLTDGRSRAVYAYTNAEFEHYRQDNTRATGEAGAAWNDVTRFRGIAQFTRTECSELLIDPVSRRQVLLRA